MTSRAGEDDTPQPGLACWYCGSRLRARDVLRDGILRSRSEREGGPYRLFICPSCRRSNLCEKTPRKRWFSSPHFRPNIFDYLFGRLFLPDPEDFLRAVSWYRENEERRRYFFERDGDRRYSGVGLLEKFWSLGSQEEDGARRKTRRKPDDASRRRREEQREKAEKLRAERAKDRRKGRARPGAASGGREDARPRVASPWEILGLRDGASEVEIRRRFYRLAVQYHPDKVHHLGAEFQEVATKKFKELQEAYETLLRRAED